MGRDGSGVEKRPNSIRLFFVDQDGERRRETLTINGKPMKPTAPNLAHAERVAAEIRKAVRLKVFKLADFFPDSPRAQEQARDNSFGTRADQWLASKGQLSEATRDQYATAVRRWKALFGASTPIESITHAMLAEKIGKEKWSSGKALNNYLIALRGIFGMEYHGRRAIDDPTSGIENAAVVKKKPDPLTAAERDRILAHMAKTYDKRVVAYFTFAFYTGMRPEEIIALRWGDIDFNLKTIRVQRVRTFKGSERDGSKTHTERDVDLGSMALEALSTMKPFTFLKRDENGEEVDIFENPVTGRAWHDERSQRDHYWHPTLKRLGIRKRRPYCTRHSFLTIGLMHGVQPSYLAQQAGHSLQMLLQTYTLWIRGADGGSERQKMEAAQSGQAGAKFVA